MQTSTVLIAYDAADYFKFIDKKVFEAIKNALKFHGVLTLHVRQIHTNDTNYTNWLLK